MDDLKIAFVGNPNCGKTTLFNAYTGANLKTANWPGVTVNIIEGHTVANGRKITLIDLPGTYSLTNSPAEEGITSEFIEKNEIDTVINVANAANLAQSLYLTLQLIELQKPVVLAVNMIDVINERGMKFDAKKLSEILKIPVVCVSARKSTGLDDLLQAAQHSVVSAHFAHERVLTYSEDIENALDELTEKLTFRPDECSNPFPSAIHMLENDRNYNDYGKRIINEKYDFIENVVAKVLKNRENAGHLTQRLDNILTHNIFGFPIFLLIMAAVFSLTFLVGDKVKFLFEGWLTSFSEAVYLLLTKINTADFLKSLVCDGIITGIGSILTFLPNILILFLLLGLLEDSGYMSRAAYVTDSIMQKLGLTGRSFIPLILGFGCTVPAIMAARTLENKKSKIRTIMIVPFMSCSARLPIYVMMSQMFFPTHSTAAAFSMYLIGMVTALTAAFIFSRGENRFKSTLLIELPEYKTPNARTIAIYVWDKLRDYLTKAGTTIFLASLVLWFILNFNFNGQAEFSDSFASYLGHMLSPFLSCAGLGYWQICVALIAGIAAKEAVVSSISVIYGIGNISSHAELTLLASKLASQGFTALNAYSLMLFCLLYVPCIASITTIRRETGSAKYAVFAVCMQLLTAWGVSTVFYQLGRMIF